ncbi:MAG: sigma-E processing peptidase SpoIIGA [Peptostreptococcaceae bacterium]|nr:sigma-E processing peptidase SpoIIGA [Peptostreptococcaceae bacterium]
MYVEYYAVENLLINYIIISCTSMLTKNYINKKRKFIGAFIGMIYSLMYLVPSMNILFTLPIKLLTILIITSITFSYRDINEYVRILLIFYFTNIFIAGSSFFIIYFTGISHVTISLIITTTFVSGIILNYIFKDIKTLKYMKEMKKNIDVSINNIDFEFEALIDSGNLLKDPISKNEVVVVKASKLKGIIPDEFLDFDYNKSNMEDINEFIDKLDEEISNRVRLIPFRNISDSSFIIGIKADYIKVDERKISNIVLGLSNLKEEEYSAILNPQLLLNI